MATFSEHCLRPNNLSFALNSGKQRLRALDAHPHLAYLKADARSRPLLPERRRPGTSISLTAAAPELPSEQPADMDINEIVRRPTVQDF